MHKNLSTLKRRTIDVSKMIFAATIVLALACLPFSSTIQDFGIRLGIVMMICGAIIIIAPSGFLAALYCIHQGRNYW